MINTNTRRAGAITGEVLRPTQYLGRHLLAEFWGCSRIDDPNYVENALVISAGLAGATIIQAHIHHFGEGLGVTGVLVLAQSHISIHSWPEESGYAAIDVFMCGTAKPRRAIDALIELLVPSQVLITEYERGAVGKHEKRQADSIR